MNGDEDEPKSLVQLIDQVKAQYARTEELYDFMHSVIALLPSTYYMDPPDGGDVTVLEQLQRMAKDADRHRKARQGAYRLAVGNPTPEEFDAACDAVVRL